MGLMDRMREAAEAGEDKAATRKEEAARRRAEQEVEQARRKAEKEAAQAEAEFRATPVGQARTARENGDRWFQIEMVASNTDRGVLTTMLANVNTRNKPVTGHGTVLTAIEDEGWELMHAGFIFREVGQVSRDKFLSSGQQVGTIGETIGYYLFKLVA